MSRAQSLLPEEGSFEDQRGDYLATLDPGTINNRFLRTRYGMGGAGNLHLDPWRLWFTRETVRHMVRSDALPGQMLERLTDFIYGGQIGFRIEPDTSEPTLNEELQGRFKAWAADKQACDAGGERTFQQLVWQTGLQGFQDGEMFALLRHDGRCQLVEADRCVSPIGSMSYPEMAGNKAFGVCYDADLKPVGFYFARLTPCGPSVGAESVKYYPRWSGGLETVCHVYSTTRATAHRGYPLLTPIIVESGMLDDLDFATIVKAQQSACVVGVAEQDPRVPARGPFSMGNETTTTNAAGKSEIQTDTKAGMVLDLAPGRSFKGFAPPIPSDNHLDHCKYVLKKISAAQHMPYILAMLDANETNLSAWRGSMDAARETWRRKQCDMGAQLVLPAYRWQVARWLPELGRTARRLWAAGTLAKASVIWRGWGYIDPLKDASADEKVLQNTLNSPSSLLAGRGLDYSDVARQTVKDRGLLIAEACAMADGLNQQFPAAGISWRDCIFKSDAPAAATLAKTEEN